MGDLVEDVHDALFLEDGREDDRHVVERGDPGLQAFGILLHGMGVLLDGIPLVDDDDAGLLVFLDQVEDRHVLGFHAVLGVDHQDADVAVLDRADGAHDGVEFQILADAVLPAHAGGVDQHEFMAELVVVRRDGVAGRAGDRGHDVALLAEQGVGQGRFADIRLADDGDVGEIGVRIFDRFLLRKQADDLVEQVSGTAAVGGGNAPDLAESQAVELIGVIHLLAGVDLVDAQDDRLAAAAQHVGDFGIVVGDAGGCLHHEQDDIGLIDGDDDLLADFFLERVVRSGRPSAGIHYGKLGSAPVTFAVMAVAGDARGLVDDGLTHPDQTVEEGGLAHIRASDDSY